MIENGSAPIHTDIFFQYVYNFKLTENGSALIHTDIFFQYVYNFKLTENELSTF